MVARLLLRAESVAGYARTSLVVAMLAGVAAALTLAAVIGRIAQAPWERTWRASGAPHLTLYGQDRATLAATARRREDGLIRDARRRGSSASTPAATTSRPGSRRCRRRASGGPRSSRAPPTACCSSAASPAGSASGRVTP